MEFRYLSSAELSKMSLDQIKQYYMSLRKYEYEQNIPVKNVDSVIKYYPVIRCGLKLERLFLGQRMKIISDKHVQTNQPKIYVSTHIGRCDIEIGASAVGESSFLLMGDPGETYCNLDGKILNLKGVIYFETADALDRKIALRNCIQVIRQGGNIFIFPEGAWNLTENQVVMKLFNGAVHIARETGAEIIPLAIEQYDRDYYVKIGKNIDITDQLARSNREISDDLRDIMCTLRWQIWEHKQRSFFSKIYNRFPTPISQFFKNNNIKLIKRTTLPSDYHDIYVNKIMAESNGEYTIEEIERTRYKDSSSDSPEKAFSFYEQMIPSKENAFLLQKKFQYDTLRHRR